MTQEKGQPSTFNLAISPVGWGKFQLRAAQELPLPPEKVFPFFEDPRNLFRITPDWLDFRMVQGQEASEVFEGVNFAYTIRWFGVTLRWRSRIVDYHPPDRFTDVQIAGPYRQWSHLHTFEAVPGGTRMGDEVTYRLPFSGLGRLFHQMVVRKQLEDIFRYRAREIGTWVQGQSSVCRKAG
jgi:hypothetical protein